jgi:hypothetical protein
MAIMREKNGAPEAPDGAAGLEGLMALHSAISTP